MPTRDEVNARANALLMAPASRDFYHGVNMLRGALANGGCFSSRDEVKSCAVGLLMATDGDMHAGIAALAVMLRADIDLQAQRRRIEVLQPERYSLEMPQMVLIDAGGREVTR